jgi:hypothetical protein
MQPRKKAKKAVEEAVPTASSSSSAAGEPAAPAAAGTGKKKGAAGAAPSPHAGPAEFTASLHAPVASLDALAKVVSPRPAGGYRVLSWYVMFHSRRGEAAGCAPWHR